MYDTVSRLIYPSLERNVMYVLYLGYTNYDIMTDKKE